MLHLRSFHLAVQFYQHAEGLKLPHHLKEQLLRASSSVALNLSEGTGKLSKKDRCRFFQIALGSVRECQAIKSLAPAAFSAECSEALNRLGGSVYLLIRNMRP
jgi:four helix bundle protein